jgi:hypothetical protein
MASQFLTLIVDGSEWLASRPYLFTSGDIASDTHWIGGLVGPRDDVDSVE